MSITGIILTGPKDFEEYKKELDEIHDYKHRHIGEPLEYPCKVISKWYDDYDDPDGPYMHEHQFIYITKHKCPNCGQEIELLV